MQHRWHSNVPIYQMYQLRQSVLYMQSIAPSHSKEISAHTTSYFNDLSNPNHGPISDQ